MNKKYDPLDNPEQKIKDLFVVENDQQLDLLRLIVSTYWTSNTFSKDLFGEVKNFVNVEYLIDLVVNQSNKKQQSFSIEDLSLNCFETVDHRKPVEELIGFVKLTTLDSEQNCFNKVEELFKRVHLFKSTIQLLLNNYDYVFNNFRVFDLLSLLIGNPNLIHNQKDLHSYLKIKEKMDSLDWNNPYMLYNFDYLDSDNDLQDHLQKLILSNTKYSNPDNELSKYSDVEIFKTMFAYHNWFENDNDKLVKLISNCSTIDEFMGFKELLEEDLDQLKLSSSNNTPVEWLLELIDFDELLNINQVRNGKKLLWNVSEVV